MTHQMDEFRPLTRVAGELRFECGHPRQSLIELLSKNTDRGLVLLRRMSTFVIRRCLEKKVHRSLAPALEGIVP